MKKLNSNWFKHCSIDLRVSFLHNIQHEFCRVFKCTKYEYILQNREVFKRFASKVNPQEKWGFYDLKSFWKRIFVKSIIFKIKVVIIIGLGT